MENQKKRDQGYRAYAENDGMIMIPFAIHLLLHVRIYMNILTAKILSVNPLTAGTTKEIYKSISITL